jgi:hypothetical protein
VPDIMHGGHYDPRLRNNDLPCLTNAELRAERHRVAGALAVAWGRHLYHCVPGPGYFADVSEWLMGRDQAIATETQRRTRRG